MRIVGVRGGIYLITVLDVSKVGLQVSCSAAFATGTRVEVRCRGARVEGEVRYSREVRPQEIHLGIEADASEETDLAHLFQINKPRA
jgi:hypothetical protein